MDYARALREIREEASMSKRHLAQLIGCDRSFVTHLESGRRKPSLETLEQISMALKTPLHVFVLRAAEDEDLRAISPQQARQLSILLTKAVRDE